MAGKGDYKGDGKGQGKGQGKGDDMDDNMYALTEAYCHGCGKWHETVLNWCCLCWHVFVDGQRRTHGADAVTFFPPELENTSMQQRRANFDRMCRAEEQQHRAELQARLDAQLQHRAEQEDWGRAQALRTLETNLHGAAANNEDTFVLLNWIANKYIYIYIERERYAYVHIYRERERKRNTEREKER